jgi:hypothetical protein
LEEKTLNKQLDRADLELQLIYWTKKKDENLKEEINHFGKNPIKSLELKKKRDEYWEEIHTLRDLLNSKTIEIPEKLERFGRTYVLEKNENN